MQIPQDKQYRSPKIGLLGVGLLALCGVGYALWPPAQASEAAVIATATFEKIATSISAYGSLQPKTRYSIVGLVNGNIDNMALRPGDLVNVGDAIITLVNPKLERELEQVQLSLLGERADFEKLMATQKMALAQQQSRIQTAGFDLTIAKSRLSAQQKLAELSIVSAIDLQQTELQYEKVALLVAQEKEAYHTLQATQSAEKKAQEFYLLRAEKQIELLQKDIDNLVIRAGIDGLIVKLDTELEEGLSIEEGKVLGQIADPSSLYALLRIQVGQASLLALQQRVDIQVKGQSFSGVIERISPNVENATVEMDVKFIDALPSNGLSNMAVTASIHIESAQATILLDKPQHINAPGPASLLIANEQSLAYEVRNVTVGWVGEQKIQILAGLALNERVILINPETWKETLGE